MAVAAVNTTKTPALNKKVWDRHTVPLFILTLFNRLYGCELLARPLGDGFIIGFGSAVMPNGSAVKSGDQITQDEANAMCLKGSAEAVQAILSVINWPLNAVQASCLMMAVHLEGESAFDKSAIVAMINEGRLDLAGRQLLLVGSDGNDLATLQRQEYLHRLFVGTAQESAAAYEAVNQLTLAVLQKEFRQAQTDQTNWS